MQKSGWLRGIAIAVVMGFGQPAAAQLVTDAPSGAETKSEPAALDPTKIQVPDLSFTPKAEDINDYDKFFYFHREGTNFAEAYADIRECDGYARNLGGQGGGAFPVPYPYAGTLAGVAGGLIGSAVADAVHGSAERRRLRRINLRTCMRFKEYRTYGLPKEVWIKFNFEEGLSQVGEERRQLLLQKQAKIASGPKPQQGEIQ